MTRPHEQSPSDWIGNDFQFLIFFRALEKKQQQNGPLTEYANRFGGYVSILRVAFLV